MRAPILVCEYCDAVYQPRPLQRGERAVCLRCDATLARHQGDRLPWLLALTVTAAIVFVIANCSAIVTLDLQGNNSQATLWGAIRAAWEGGIGPVAVLAALTVFFFPLAQIVLMGYVLIALLGLRRLPGLIDALHALNAMRPWCMVEVFLLGALVAIVKMGVVAEVAPQPGLFAFGVLTLLLTALNGCELRGLWQRVDACRDH